MDPASSTRSFAAAACLALAASAWALAGCNSPTPEAASAGAAEAVADTHVTPEPAEREDAAGSVGEVDAEADTEAAPGETSPAAGELASPELTADPEHSRIELFVSKATAGHEVKFERFTATLGVDGDAPRSLAIAVNIGSVVTDQSALTTHLKSADFFDVAKHPRARFVSTSITPLADNDDATHTIAGDLTIKRTTKRIEFPAQLLVTDGEFTGTATMKLKAADFGMDYPGMAEEMVDEQVELEVKLVFPRDES